MGKKRKSPPAERPFLSSAARDPGGATAAALLCATLLGAGLLVDPRAESSFDAPKRVAALACAALSTLAVFGFSRWRNPFAGRSEPRSGRRLSNTALLLLLASLALALFSALASPRRALSLDALRVVLLTALFLPLGASRAMAENKRFLIGAFFGMAVIDAAASILQARGLYQPFELVTPGGRESTGAFAGNTGYLALALSLASVAALGLLPSGPRPLVRVFASAVLLLFLAALLVNQNLTSLTALAAGAVVLLSVRYGRRALLPGFGLLVLLAAGVAISPPTRERVAQAAADLRTRQWDRLTSYRLAPWAAAAVMASERPFLGFGPGTFEAEFVPHRLEAELRLRRRLTNPLTTSSYAEAHCDYLQPFAEAGAPAALAAIGSAAALLAALARASRRSPEARLGEACLLLAFLSAGAASALTWFPLQRPITSIPLLLAAGRAWRISRGDPDHGRPGWQPSPSDTPDGPRRGWRRPHVRILCGLGLTLLLAWAFSPEIRRYRAERSLRAGSRALAFLLAHPSEIETPPEALQRIFQLATSAAADLPRDPRPRLLAGSARLVAGEPELALDSYREALTAGEKAETELNMGRAYEALGRQEAARAAYLRAVWISPALLPLLLPDAAGPLRTEVERLENDLKAGRQKAPPPIP